MAILSQIKLRQINLPEISGYIQSVIPAYLSGTGFNVNGNIVPINSGKFNLGDTGNYFQNIYTNTITMPSGSGIMFGPNLFNAYISGISPVVQVGVYKVAINNAGVSIIGPQGPSGLQGIVGPSGFSGIGVTGYTNYNNTLVLFFSNGTSGNPISLPSGAIGATGRYTTGFYQSGNYLSPVFSNGSTGSSFFIPSGQTGPQGTVGNIYIDINQLSGFHSGAIIPYVTIPNLNPSITQNPPFNFNLI